MRATCPRFAVFNLLSSIGWLATLAALGLCRAAAVPATDIEVKAVWLFHLSQFVDWPSSAFSSGHAPLIIGVLGRDPFGAMLDDLVRNEMANDHPLVVQRYRRVNQIGSCHLLFVCASEAPRFGEICEALKGRPVLTVGDVASFLGEGGIVRFVVQNNRTQLWINWEAAKAADLEISSQLLRHAVLVAPGKD